MLFMLEDLGFFFVILLNFNNYGKFYRFVLVYMLRLLEKDLEEEEERKKLVEVN